MQQPQYRTMKFTLARLNVRPKEQLYDPARGDMNAVCEFFDDSQEASG